MSDAALRDPRIPAPVIDRPEDYLHVEQTLSSWFFTTDHKRIGILYLVSITGFFVIGAIAAGIVRLALVVPDGSILSNEVYNRMFTLHGVIMVWFFLVPSIPNTLGNFLLPLMIGAKDLAFPKINLLSWYVFVTASLFTLFVLLWGGVDTGWTFYTPLSTQYANGYVIAAVLGIIVVGYSSILTGLNFIVTVHKMRAPGMTWFHMPLFVWSLYATSLILVLATPVLTIALVLVFVDRAFGLGVFNPEQGGDPVLFQHLFWFYSHPVVYVMVLPGMGVMSELVTAYAYKKIFGYKFIAFSSLAIAVIGFFVWGHHMFYNGITQYSALTFSLMSFIVAVPSAIKVYNWAATIHKGQIRLDTPMLYAMGWIGLFVIGGVTGLMLASTALDGHVHDTYFVVAHFHYIMVGATVVAFLGGIHYWWPKMTGRLYSEPWGRVSALLMFIGFNMTFFPQYILGYMGMPRRYAVYPESYQVLNVLSSAGATILAAAYLFPMIYLVWSLWYGEKAGDNPWHAKGLEWTTTSPPPKHNFRKMPIVDFDPYDYSNEPPEE
ncbi:MAG: cbb3-type cytochrome c oxidase subunit I [Rhodospirillales bacterium]|nr:cbb3-type cytochrome c oxidase subunit I [Rhodospirillales bacterium]